MATITAAAGGGNWNVGASWVGGVSPGSGDGALLTAASGNITIPSATTVACRSLDCSTYTGTFTFAATTSVLNVGDASGGALTFVAGMTLTLTGNGLINFVATTASTTYTLTSAGKTLPNITVAPGASTTIQLADNLTIVTPNSALTLTSGILDTNGKTVTGATINLNGSTARTLTLGASNISLNQAGGGYTSAPNTNLTVSANTATLTLTGANAIFDGGGFNFNGLTLALTGVGGGSILGANTFANLTRTSTAALNDTLTLSANQTVTGTLTLTGNSAANRLWVASSVVGTPRTITCNGTVTASRVDFEDIVGAGSASWNLAGITDGSGDLGGNSGITFTTPATKYGVATGNWSATATWALTSGGAAGAPYPLPQDDVILNAASGGINVTMDMGRHCRDLTSTGFTGTLTLASSSNQRFIFGSLTLTSGMTFSAVGNFTFAGRGSHTINMAGKAFGAGGSRQETIGRFGGTYTLLANADFSTLATNTNGGLLIGNGASFDANGFNVAATRVTLTGSGGTVSLGSGTWTLAGNADATIWNNVSTATVNPGTSNIVVANTSAITRTFAGAGKTYNDLTYTVAGSTGGLDVTGSNTFHDLNFSDVTNARTLRFTAATTTTFTGAWNVNGTAGKLMSIDTITAATHNLSKASGTVSSNYLSVKNSLAGGGAAWYAGANSTDAGGNTGWIFTAAPSASAGRRTLRGVGV